jgi:hypothetical protein
MISSGEAAGLRADLLRMLTHRYSRTPVTQGTEDAWFDAADTPGSVATAQPCLYSPHEVIRSETGGRVTVDRPNLRVPSTDPIAVGDLVSAIADQDGNALEGTTVFKVDSIRAVAAFGPVLQRRVYLSAAQVAE